MLVLAAMAIVPATSDAGAAATTDALAGKRLDRLFDVLNLDDPRLIRVKALVARGNSASARRALNDHFKTRRVRTGFWPPDRRSANDADALVKHVFSFYGSRPIAAGDPIDWDGVWHGDRELTYALNRHQYLLTLAEAWRESRDPKYVRAFLDHLRDWIAHNPIESAVNWAAWRDLETATRIGTWCDLFFQFLPAPEFTPDDQALMLLSLHEQAEWLAPQVRAGRSDWSISVATGLATVGVLFPEFKEAAAWRSKAYGELMRDMEIQILPDGSHQAFSTDRHNACLTGFWLPMKIAVENRVGLPQGYRATIEKMCEYQGYLRRPDGNYPPFNASDPNNAQMLVLAGGQFFGRSDLTYIGSFGRAGTAPTTTSLLFRDSGVAVMRDDWGREANYLAIDAGPYGTSYQHEDKLGFELAAFGRTVLVDPGRYSLDIGDPLTAYLESTEAHNTITVDGGGQMRRQVRGAWTPEGNAPIDWVSRKSFDYLAGTYSDGYETAPGVVHRRRVFFVKEGPRPYWIVSDRVEGEGSHTIESRFQFIDGPLESAGERGWRTAGSGANLALVCAAGGTTVSARIVEGSRQPMGGWVSVAYRKIDPAPQLVLERSGQLPQTMTVVLAPFEGAAVAPEVSVRAEDGKTSAADRTLLDIDFGDFRDTVFLDHALTTETRTIEGVKASGCFVVVRSEGDGPGRLLIEGKP